MVIKDLLEELRKRYTNTNQGQTHSETCYLWHPICAILMLIELVETSEESKIALQKRILLTNASVLARIEDLQCSLEISQQDLLYSTNANAQLTDNLIQTNKDMTELHRSKDD